MRIFVLGLLLLFTFPLYAGTINIPAITTDSVEQDPYIRDFLKWLNINACASVNLPDNCTDAEIKAKDPDKTVYTLNLNGFETYYTKYTIATIDQIVNDQKDRKASQDIARAYKLATPTIKAQVDALLGF